MCVTVCVCVCLSVSLSLSLSLSVCKCVTSTARIDYVKETSENLRCSKNMLIAIV